MEIKNLKQLRKSKKIIQKDIAKMLGVTTTQYITWEQNSTIPDKYIERLSEILGIDFTTNIVFDPDYIKALRLVSGATQVEISEYAEVTQQSIVAWEKESNYGYNKCEDSLIEFYKKKFIGKSVVPVRKKEVPGALIFNILQECYILIYNEDLFEYSRYCFEKLNVHIYKIFEMENEKPSIEQ